MYKFNALIITLALLAACKAEVTTPDLPQTPNSTGNGGEDAETKPGGGKSDPEEPGNTLEWLHPTAATSYQNARFARCLNQEREIVASFPDADLYEGQWGIITGDPGIVKVGHRFLDQDEFEVHEIQGGLMTNGPVVTFLVVDYGIDFILQFTTADFHQGTGDFEVDDVEIPLSCEFFQSDGYDF